MDAAAAQQGLVTVDEKTARAPRKGPYAKADLGDLGLRPLPRHGRAAGVEVGHIRAPEPRVRNLDLAGVARAGRDDGAIRVQNLELGIGARAGHPHARRLAGQRLHAQIPGADADGARRTQPQVDGTIDAAACIPARRRLLLRGAPHLNYVPLAWLQHVVDPDREGTIAIGNLHERLAVDQDLRMRHHTAELELHATACPIGGHVELLGIAIAAALVIGAACPARRIRAPALGLHRVVRQRHKHRGIPLGRHIAASDFGCGFRRTGRRSRVLRRDLLKEPTAIEVVPLHGVPSLINNPTLPNGPDSHDEA